MQTTAHHGSPLSYLENREVSAVTFIREYLQLHFDGPFLNVYIWPRVQMPDQIFDQSMPGYRDALCGRIGKIIVAGVEEKKVRLALHFADDVVLEISLRPEDRATSEVAMLQDGTGKFWNAW